MKGGKERAAKSVVRMIIPKLASNEADLRPSVGLEGSEE